MPADARAALLLAIADDELILGHRMSEWTGWVPYLEEDLALSSIAQDEIAHARTLFEIAAPMLGTDVDALALGRTPDEYRNAIICERTNRDFAYTLARHWLYELADDVRLGALEETSFTELREAVVLFRLEEQYHRAHAETWFAHLAHGPVEARHRFAAALSDAFGEARAIFEPYDDESTLLGDGTLPRASGELRTEWLARVGEALTAASLDHVLTTHVDDGEMIPTSSGEIETESTATHASDGSGGRRGKHSEDFLPLWEEMTGLYRAHPGARW
jgi:ring-1,2-phenylacetyl-CoA epoxidase subunit PaaC